jgi:mannose-6-phosphate isomerase
MFSLYPMKFKPILKEKIWGGKKIYETFHFGSNISSVGELWSLSGIRDDETLVENGHFSGNTANELTEVFMDDFLGGSLYEKYGTEFPLLFKIIDANDYLSVQVHPNDEIAKKKRNQAFGKSEMWYILDAKEGSEIVLGFNQKMDRERLEKHIQDRTLESVLNFVKVQKGDIVFLPSGMVHALGPGIVVAEIQQSSDITYRLYDWDRVDGEGNTRELHIEDALDAINYDMQPQIISNFKLGINETTHILDCPYFSSSMVHLQSRVEKYIAEIDSFIVYFVISGKIQAEYGRQSCTVHAGECLLVPAMIDAITINPISEAMVLEIVAK